MNFESKIKAIESHLIEKGSITSYEVIKLYWATRLSGIYVTKESAKSLMEIFKQVHSKLIELEKRESK